MAPESPSASEIREAMAAVDAYAILALGDGRGRLHLVMASAASRETTISVAQSHSADALVLVVERFVAGKVAAQIVIKETKVALMALGCHVRGSWFDLHGGGMLAAIECTALDNRVRAMTRDRLISEASAKRQRDIERVIGR